MYGLEPTTTEDSSKIRTALEIGNIFPDYLPPSFPLVTPEDSTGEKVDREKADWGISPIPYRYWNVEVKGEKKPQEWFSQPMTPGANGKLIIT